MVQSTLQIRWWETCTAIARPYLKLNGETLAGLVAAKKQGIVTNDEIAVIDSTAHALKFSGFQDMYFENRFPPEFGIIPDPKLMNAPTLIRPNDLEKVPAPGNPLVGKDFERFVTRTSQEIAKQLHLTQK